MNSDIQARDRKRGALLGLAVGDALGAAVEFRSPGSFPPVTGYRDGGPHGLAPGEWTDDTSMALALADSIAQAGWDLHDQARRYLAWWRRGDYSVTGRCFDIGTTTARALSRFESGGDPLTSASRSEQASGNGSIMRLAPVPIRFADGFPRDLTTLVERAVESSLPTHASPQCLSACALMAVILAGLIHGRSREEMLSPQADHLGPLRALPYWHSDIEAIARGSFREKEPPAIEGSGYVASSLEAALWAFHRAADFRAAVLPAVNLGDDADTTGAVCGQFAGAFWGEAGIPTEWRDGLARRDMLERALVGVLK